MKNNELKFYQDFDKTEGSIVMENAKTIELYHQLRGAYDKKSAMDEVMENPAYCFFAFNNEQFDEGYAAMKPHLAEGEKIINYGAGAFFSPEGLERFNQARKNTKQRIKEECDPQEVYCYEYNNCEGMYDYDGDKRAMETIIYYFGKRIAKTIKRFSARHSIEYIISEYK